MRVRPMTSSSSSSQPSYPTPPAGAFLIQSAGGSAVGRIVIALAKQWGLKTVSLVRRREQVEELKALGGDEVSGGGGEGSSWQPG